MKLLTPPNSNPKTAKSLKVGYSTAILHLSPGGYRCPHASPGCLKACLNTAGRAAAGPCADRIHTARKRRTDMLVGDYAGFMSQLLTESRQHSHQAAAKGYTAAVRLNGTSDLRWEKMSFSDDEGHLHANMMTALPDVVWYDYTKFDFDLRPDHALPANYHLTFSRSETNENEARYNLLQGRNVTVVFDTKRSQDLPTTWEGWPVIDGDTHDARMLDKGPDGDAVVVGLRAKGRAIHDQSGFVVRRNV